MSANLSATFYLISGILFILALRGLSSPETSRQGNYFGIAGMAIAIVVTFLKTKKLIKDWRETNDRQSYFEWMQWLAEQVIALEDTEPPVPAHILHKDWTPNL